MPSLPAPAARVKADRPKRTSRPKPPRFVRLITAPADGLPGRFGVLEGAKQDVYLFEPTLAERLTTGVITAAQGGLDLLARALHRMGG